MNIGSIPLGTIGTTEVALPYLTVGSGAPRGTVIALQHGGELAPLWVLKELLQEAGILHGTATIIPVANPFGFIAGSRNEVIEAKDLNRQFPGNPKGDFSARLAAAIFSLAQQSDFVIDLHTFSRQSPFLAGYVRASGPVAQATQQLIRLLAPDAVWAVDEGRGEDRRFRGSLDGALTAVGVPCVFVEMPNYHTIAPKLVSRISTGIVRVFQDFGNDSVTGTPAPEYAARYLYADEAGLFEPSVAPLDQVKPGQQLGTTYSLPNFSPVRVLSPLAGTVLTIRGRDVLRTGSKLASIGIPVNDS